MPDGTLTPPRLARRGFLEIGGGLALAVVLPPAPRPARSAAGTSPNFAPNAFIRIDRQGAVTLVMPSVEMGQGTYTSFAMLLAEELEVDLDQVRLEHAPPDAALYANPILHTQLTGLSASVRGFWTPLRQAGAVARTMLIAAAARQWGVDPAACRARRGVVSNQAGSRRLAYGDLADAAATSSRSAPPSAAASPSPSPCRPCRAPPGRRPKRRPASPRTPSSASTAGARSRW